MNNDIINKSRYKKTSSINKKKRDIKKSIKKQTRATSSSMPTLKTNIKKVKISKPKNRKVDTVKNVIACIILLLIIAVLSRAILKGKDEPFFGNILDNTNVTYENKEIKIAVVDDKTIGKDTTKNALVEELDRRVYKNLLTVDSEYNIKYDAIKSVVKISNKEYVVSLDDGINANSVKETLLSYKKDTSPYLYKLKNVKEIKNEGNVLYITLNTDDPTYIYNLNLPINSIPSDSVTKVSNDTSVTYTKKTAEDSSTNISLSSIENIDKTVAAYKEGTIDAFITSRAEIKTMLGKYEYNIKKISTGSGIYIVGNKNSKLFSQKEIRQAIAYSIDRDNIIKEVCASKGIKQDLPYIYDEAKYKYDIYAADNVMLASGYKKVSGIYTKITATGITKASLKLVVNSTDATKKKVASYIKEDLESAGIGVSIKYYDTKKLKTVIENGEYDIALVTISTNDIPSISFVNNYLNINDSVSAKIKELENSNTNDIKFKIDELKNTLSNEVACIGIYTDASYFVYKKSIEDFSYITYMNIFNEVL